MNGKQKRFFKIATLITGSLFVLMWLIRYEVFPNYIIGIDFQPYKCLPWSFYLVNTEINSHNYEFKNGDLVRFAAPANVKEFVPGTFLTKFIAGKEGDCVDISNNRIFINGIYWGDLHLWRTLGKHPGYWDRHYCIKGKQYLLLGTEGASYDGRYWGLVNASQIHGIVSVIY